MGARHESGLSVVLLAISLDRLTESLGTRRLDRARRLFQSVSAAWAWTGAG